MAFGSSARRAMVAARNNVPLKTDAVATTGGTFARIAKAGTATPVSTSSNTQADSKLGGSIWKIKRKNLFGN